MITDKHLQGLIRSEMDDTDSCHLGSMKREDNDTETEDNDTETYTSSTNPNIEVISNRDEACHTRLPGIESQHTVDYIDVSLTQEKSEKTSSVKVDISDPGYNHLYKTEAETFIAGSKTHSESESSDTFLHQLQHENITVESDDYARQKSPNKHRDANCNTDLKTTSVVKPITENEIDNSPHHNKIQRCLFRNVPRTWVF